LTPLLQILPRLVREIPQALVAYTEKFSMHGKVIDPQGAIDLRRA
jgi:hypothetical protein